MAYILYFMLNEPFYDGGLRFSCTRCSSCCRYDSGFVFLSKKDLSLLAAECKMEYNKFVKNYCRWVNAENGEQLSLKEKSNFDCIFWDQGCVVYNARPLQCRNFPFCHSIVCSSQAWKTAASGCPGINRGILRHREEIESILARRVAEPLITREAAGGMI